MQSHISLPFQFQQKWLQLLEEAMASRFTAIRIQRTTMMMVMMITKRQEPQYLEVARILKLAMNYMLLYKAPCQVTQQHQTYHPSRSHLFKIKKVGVTEAIVDYFNVLLLKLQPHLAHRCVGE